MLLHKQVEQVDESALEIIRVRLRERMEALRISGNEISRRANLGLSYVNDILSGQSRNPHNSRLKSVASVLDCDVAYLTGEQDAPRLASNQGRGFDTASGLKSVLRPSVVAGRDVVEAHKIEVFSGSWPDAEGFFEIEPSGTVSPPVDGILDAYGVIVPDDTMAPRYRTGETVFVAPRRPVAAGLCVVIKLANGKTVIRETVALTPDAVEVKALSTDATMRFRRCDIATIHRIVAVAVP